MNENEKQSGGIWGGLLDLAGGFVEIAAQSAIDSYNRKKEEEEYLQEKELLKVVCESKDILQETNRQLRSLEADFDDLDEEEVNDIFITMYVYACIYNSDENWLKEIGINITDDYSDLLEKYSEVTEVIDSMQDELDRKSLLSTAFEKFHFTVRNIYDALNDFDEDDDIKELYEKGQDAIKSLRKKIKKIISCVNDEIEEYYYDDSDED